MEDAKIEVADPSPAACVSDENSDQAEYDEGDIKRMNREDHIAEEAVAHCQTSEYGAIGAAVPNEPALCAVTSEVPLILPRPADGGAASRADSVE